MTCEPSISVVRVKGKASILGEVPVADYEDVASSLAVSYGLAVLAADALPVLGVDLLDSRDDLVDSLGHGFGRVAPWTA